MRQHSTTIRDIRPTRPDGGARDRARDEAFIRAALRQARRLSAESGHRTAQGDGHQAQDLVQEAVLRAWQHADILDPGAEGIRPWLVTVVRNLVIDGYRARQARPPRPSTPRCGTCPARNTWNPRSPGRSCARRWRT
ncbi:sigma factor [Streptomyces sp. L7]